MITAFLNKMKSLFVNLWRTVISMFCKKTKVIVRDVTHDGKTDVLITSDPKFTSTFPDLKDQIENKEE